jgi:Transcriptional regulator
MNEISCTYEMKERRKMDNKKYEAAVRISENHSITKTAHDMGYSQSGVTQMINSLEEELEVRLFNRTHTGVLLTHNGEMIIPLMRDELKCDEKIREECSRVNGRETGTVYIGAMHSVSAEAMPALLEIFRKKYPEIQTILVTADPPFLREMIEDGRIDMALTEKKETEGGEFRKLIVDEIKMIMPKGHPLSRRKAVTLDNVADYPFITLIMDTDAHSYNYWLPPAWEKTLSSNIAYTCEDDLSLINMVAHGLGIAVEGTLMTGSFMDRLDAVPLSPKLHQTIGLYAKSFKTLSPSAKSFVECVEDNMEAWCEIKK